MKIKELIAMQYSRLEEGQRLYFVTESYIKILERFSIELKSLFLDIYSNHQLNGEKYSIRLKHKNRKIAAES